MSTRRRSVAGRPCSTARHRTRPSLATTAARCSRPPSSNTSWAYHLDGSPTSPLPRTAQLRALGNGVVPQQAAHAVSLLPGDLAGLLRTDHGPQAGEGVLAA